MQSASAINRRDARERVSRRQLSPSPPRVAAHFLAARQEPASKVRGRPTRDQSLFADGVIRVVSERSCRRTGADAAAATAESATVAECTFHSESGFDERHCRWLSRREWNPHLRNRWNSQRFSIVHESIRWTRSVSRYDVGVQHHTENVDAHQSCGCDQCRPRGRSARTIRDLCGSDGVDAERDAHASRRERSRAFRGIAQRSEQCTSVRSGAMSLQTGRW